MLERNKNTIIDQLEWFLSTINNETSGYRFNELFMVQNSMKRSWPNEKVNKKSRQKEELAIIIANKILEKNESRYDYYLAIIEGEPPFSIICFYLEESNLIKLLENVNRESDVTIFENFAYEERFLKIDDTYYELKDKEQISEAINVVEFRERMSRVKKNIALKTTKS